MASRRPAGARPRIVDVAARAGVSPQTVSNVINRRGGFSEATREKVEAAIAELGFHPNRYAQSLRSRRTMLLGFDLSTIALDVANPFTLTFLGELVRAATARGYRVVVFTQQEGQEDDLHSVAASGIVDGFVVNNAQPRDPRVAALTAAGVPFVVFGRTLPDEPQCWVDIDNRTAMHAAVDHVVDRGRRRIAFVGLPLEDYWNLERYEGVRDRLWDKGIRLQERWTVVGPPDRLPARIRQLLDRAVRPDTVITSSDSVAVVVHAVATELGLAVPEDLAIVGFDAGPLTRTVEPVLTSIAIPVARIADTVVDRLLAQIASGVPSGPGVLVGTDLVVGGST